MSYAHSTRHGRRAAREDAGRMPVHGGSGATTYLVFALCVGFAAALVLGIVA